MGRTGGPSVRGDEGRGGPIAAPLDSVSFIGASETFSDLGQGGHSCCSRWPQPVSAQARLSLLLSWLSRWGWSVLQLSRRTVIAVLRPGRWAVPSKCSEVAVAREGGWEGRALQGEGQGGGAAARLEGLPPLPPVGGPAVPPRPPAPGRLSECPQGRRGERPGPGRAALALRCRREQGRPWNLS